MKPSNRQLLILDILHQQGQVKVQQLASHFGISAETIRRDLNALSISGRLLKTHGGGVIPQLIGEGPYQQRMRENVTAKRQIAKKASQLILPGQSLFIDTGSTTLAFAEELSAIEGLTIITNSADIAKVVDSMNKSQVFLVGGKYCVDNRQTIGSLAISQISQFRANHAILTLAGIHAEAGITDFNINEAHIARAMIQYADNIIVLADSTKLGQIAPFEVSRLEQVDCLVCNGKIDAAMEKALTATNIKVISAW